MSATEDLVERVKRLIAENGGVSIEEVRSDAHFRDDLGLDSLDIVELVMAIEKEFDVEIPDDDAEEIHTVQMAIDYILDHQ